MVQVILLRHTDTLQHTHAVTLLLHNRCIYESVKSRNHLVRFINYKDLCSEPMFGQRDTDWRDLSLIFRFLLSQAALTQGHKRQHFGARMSKEQKALVFGSI